MIGQIELYDRSIYFASASNVVFVADVRSFWTSNSQLLRQEPLPVYRSIFTFGSLVVVDIQKLSSLVYHQAVKHALPVTGLARRRLFGHRRFTTST